MRRFLRQLYNSLITATIRGTATGASSGVYTARLCSGGKYRRANIPGLKNAREADVNASRECCKASHGYLFVDT